MASTKASTKAPAIKALICEAGVPVRFRSVRRKAISQEDARALKDIAMDVEAMVILWEENIVADEGGAEDEEGMVVSAGIQ